MNNLLTSISFTISSNKGVYALLLGSGISRNSGIPTGWEIVLDLIRKLAVQTGDDCEGNEVNWFVEKYGEEPDYSTILSKLAFQSSERVNLLRPYFEPTEEERENHLKEPTKAHKAIAQLIKDGYIKVVITTNFDRLLENALRDIGVESQVIRHADDIQGAMPLVHSNFTLIKINGDYLDSRFLNTKHELSDYPLNLKEYILRVTNEYGLITCGWSGKWDKGLVNTIRQSENFRFSSYWTYVRECEAELSDLATFRKGQTVEITDADTFFSEVRERIDALNKNQNNHPLNADIAVERLKRYIAKGENKILLHDLFHDEQERVYAQLQKINDFSLYPDSIHISPRLDQYESILEILLPMIINGAYWCNPEHYPIFIKLFKRIGEPIDYTGTSYKVTINFQYYPVLLAIYSLGITAVKSNNFGLLFQVAHVKTENYVSSYIEKPYLLENININKFDKDILRNIFSNRNYTPLNDYLFKTLRKYFFKLIPSDKEYEDIFDFFEYILSLQYLDIVGEKYGKYRIPVGRYIWRKRYRLDGFYLKEFLDEADKLQNEWAPIKAGMFNGSYEHYIEIKTKTDEYINEIKQYYW